MKKKKKKLWAVVGGAFSIYDGSDAQCRLFELRFHGGLRNATVLRVVNNARVKWLQQSTHHTVRYAAISGDKKKLSFVPFCSSTESSTGSRYWKTSLPRCSAGSHMLVLPKGLIAPYASNEAIKRLGSTGHPEAAARRGRRRFPLLTACRALHREAKRHEGGGFHIVL